MKSILLTLIATVGFQMAFAQSYQHDSIVAYLAVGTPTPQKYSKVIPTYTDGKLSVSTNYTWSESINDWDTYSKVEYQYNSNEVVEEETSFVWNTEQGVWEKLDLIVYIYNAQSHIIREEEYRWDSDVWSPQKKVDFSISAEGSVTEAIDQSYSGSAWIIETKSTFTYNSENQITERLDYEYASGSGYTLFGRLVSNYDNKADCTEAIYYNWNSNQWKESHKTEYSYDTNIPQNQVVDMFFGFHELGHVHALLNLTTHTWTNGAWKHTLEQEYYYSETAAQGIIEVGPEPVKLFPNPGKNKVYIEFENTPFVLSIYDHQGNLIRQTNETGSSVLDVSLYSAGVYHYSVFGNGSFIKGSFLVE